MSSVVFDPPPSLRGDEGQQLLSIRSYLFQMAEQLNLALNSLDASNFTENGVAQLSDAVENASSAGMQATAAELKSLIVKTADIVRAEMDVIVANLSSIYVAQSDFGTYADETNTRITANADSLAANITDTQQMITDFHAYTVYTEGYIRQGIIGHEADLTPIIGIAIGRELKTTGNQETVNGTVYDEIDTSSNMSIWTTDKLAFYIGGTEMAYFSNNTLHVHKVKTGGLYLDEKWLVSYNDTVGFFVKYIG